MAASGELECLLALRRFEEALRLVNGWPEQLADVNDWRHDYHRAMLLAGRLREAEAFFDSAMPWFFQSEKKSFYRSASLAYRDGGQYGRAETFLRQAMEFEPEKPDVNLMSQLTQVLELQGKYEEAAEILGQVRKIAPTRRWNSYELARLQILRDQHRDAERQLRSFLEPGPDTNADRLLVIALSGQGQYSRALPIARSVLERDPGPESHTLVAWVLIAGDIDLDEGAGLAETAMGLSTPPFGGRILPFDPSPRHCLGLAYLKQGEFEKAASMLATAAAERQDRPLIQEHMAQARAGGAP